MIPAHVCYGLACARPHSIVKFTFCSSLIAFAPWDYDSQIIFISLTADWQEEWGWTKKKISISTDRVNILLYFGTKLIAQLNRWMRGQLVACLALCVLMCNGYIPAAAAAVCVLSQQWLKSVISSHGFFFFFGRHLKKSLSCFPKNILYRLCFHVC